MRHLFFLIVTLFFLSCSAGEKIQDQKLRINASWTAIEINVGEMRYMGNDGCNNFNGGIIELDESIIRFGISAATRMMCMDMEIPDLFNTSLPEVLNWEIKENKLYLRDADGKEVMLLKKID